MRMPIPAGSHQQAPGKTEASPVPTTSTAIVQPQVEEDSPQALDEVSTPSLASDHDSLKPVEDSPSPPAAPPDAPEETPPIQAQLAIGQPHDPYEQEADKIAAHVVQSSTSTVLLPSEEPPAIQRQCHACENALGHENLQPQLVNSLPITPLMMRQEEGAGAVPSGVEQTIHQTQGQGQAIAQPAKTFMDQAFGTDFSDVNIHTNSEADQLNRSLNAKAFTTGQDIYFKQGEYQPNSQTGQKLLAHELTHVVQQTGNQSLHSIHRSERLQRDPTDEDGRELAIDPEHIPDDSGIPDAERVNESIEWPHVQNLNLSWWQRLSLVEVLPINDYDPVHQPITWANKVFAAQEIMRDAGIRRIENRRLVIDGVLGPRTFLALRQVTQDESHPARTSLQTLGFNLEAIAIAESAEITALATTRPAEFLLEWDFNPLGERAVRFYDLNYDMVLGDRELMDNLLFGGPAPEGIRRDDRVELLRRMYGQESRRLQGRVALVQADRPFIHTAIDVQRAIDRDQDAPLGSALFKFVASNQTLALALFGLFEQNEAFSDAYTATSEENQAAIDEAATLLLPQAPGAPPREERTAFIFIIYLPALAEDDRAAITSHYLAEKAERERQEEAIRQAHNREAATQIAETLIQMMDDEETSRIERQLNFEGFLRRQLPDKRYFELVIDNLVSRQPNQYVRLFEVLDDLSSEVGQGTLVELSLAGRYADHPRVQSLITDLNERRADRQEHRFVTGDDPHVLLDGDERLSIGQVAGDVNSVYYRDESRERLKPASEERLSNELERQARLYFANLAGGREEERSTDEVGQVLLQRAWQAAGMSEDRDIEDIEIRESFRLMGVREAPDRGDGIQRWEVAYQQVTRYITDDFDSGWCPSNSDSGQCPETNTEASSESESEASLIWRSDSEFVNDLFWLSYSQIADVVQTAAIVVAVAAVIIVAWEVGAIAALVEAGGGAVPVLASIAFSEALYLLTHERWTLRGLLVAGIEGYLGALGFKVFAPVGAAVAGRMGTATFRQLVARWLVRHGTTGALTGVTTAPAGVFADDLIRIAQQGGGRFSGLDRYLTSAAIGLVIGAVAEIGGSAILAPIFRTADTTALNSLDEVVARAAGEGVTPTQWTAQLTGALSNMRTWARGVMDDAIADGMMVTIRQRILQAIQHYRTGWRITILRQIVDLADQPLSQQGVEGLDILLRSTRHHLDNEAMLGLLRHVARESDRIPQWLNFIGGLEDDLVRELATGGQLRQLADAPSALALATRRSPDEVATLLGQRFNHAVADLDTFANRLNQLDDAVADEVLTLLSARGASVTPNTLLRIASLGIPLNGDEVAGLIRLLSTSPNAANMEQLLLIIPNHHLRPLLIAGHGVRHAELAHLHTLASNPQQGRRLLTFADDVADVIRMLDTVDAALINDLQTFLENFGGWRRNAEQGLMNLLLHSPGSPDAARVARLAMSQHDLPGIENWTVMAGRQAGNPPQLRDLELSLNDAIAQRAADPATAIEVDFYSGIRRTRAEIQALRNTGGFNPRQHVNMDVVTTTQIREFKRANVPITTSRQFSRRLGNGAADFATLNLPRRATTGTHEHILFIDFNTQLTGANFPMPHGDPRGPFNADFLTNTVARQEQILEELVLNYSLRNPDFRRTVDRLIIQYRDAAVPPQTHTFEIAIPLP
ncbi:MAG: DUF4157 domain-containing protein [Leptolyngbya sp. SIOISBB]|nr:DUF4157 domain-containing protein [Leptolyngbya sp. SIOISBB]